MANRRGFLKAIFGATALAASDLNEKLGNNELLAKEPESSVVPDLRHQIFDRVNIGDSFTISGDERTFMVIGEL